MSDLSEETAKLPTLWRVPLEAALHRERGEAVSRYLQLATVRPDGRPANRTVVFRGFLEGTDRLQFTVDARSDKIADIEKKHWAEACWYFAGSHEQFRLLGRVELVGPDHADGVIAGVRVAVWQGLSDATRLQFLWPEPGAPRANDDAFFPPAPSAQKPPETFVVMLLEPMEIDHLRLRSTPNERNRYRRWPTGWVKEAINP